MVRAKVGVSVRVKVSGWVQGQDSSVVLHGKIKTNVSTYRSLYGSNS